LKPPVQFKEGGYRGSYVLGWANTKEWGWIAVDLSKGGERCDVGGYTLIRRGKSNQLGGYTTRR